ncbi:nuclear GTP-binding protein [Vigna unguiculata]|uniref:Nuclear GTP-binding protein n=1 Tax=Vigna unguiculata TaxID=3917 RepID=A0A4D6NG25_VIGUN|nr:nuclear GTP-binding protein [Vigna unguiculata]
MSPPKSKSVSLKKKYKVIRKVKEHNRKKAKEAKKLRLSGKNKVEKDPGIPNDWPFKEQELKALEARRAKAIEELEQKKVERKERARKRKLGLLEEEDDSKLLEDSKKNSNDFGTALKTRDSSDRAFYKDLVKVIEASDVLLEVLDARDPLGTRCPEIENMVMKSGPDKRLVLLLSKIDLVPKEALEKWLKYLREELPTVAFKCSTQQQRLNLAWRKSTKKAKSSDILQLSDCLGADTLLKLLKNYSRSHEARKRKLGLLEEEDDSKLLEDSKKNSNDFGTALKTRDSSDRAFYKDLVKVIEASDVLLEVLDARDPLGTRCPEIENMVMKSGPDKLKEILKLCLPEQLVTLYKIGSFNVGDVDDFLRKVAREKGKLKKDGIHDVATTARIVLRDWNEGKIQYYTMPPNRDQGEPSEAKIVSEFAKEFNVDEVYNNESSYIGSLKSVDDFNVVEVPSSHPLNLTEMMLEDDTETKSGNQGEGPRNVGEVDEAMEDDGGKKKDNSAASRQNEKLYTADGMLNTKLRRAEKNKRRKNKKASMDADYDFKTDYFQKGASMDSEDSESEDDDDEPN